jgi:predicted RND superfamily exporter protein
MSPFDLEEVMRPADEDAVHGMDSLSEELQAVVNETIETGKIVVLPERVYEAPPPKTKTPRKKVKTAEEAELRTVDELAVKTAEQLIKLEIQIEELTVRVEEAEVKAEEQGPSDGALIDKDPPAEDTVKMVKADPEAEAALKGSQGLAKEPQPQAKSKPKAKSKKSRAKKRPIEEVEAESDSEPEPEYVPRKSRSRAVPMSGAVGL